MSKEKPRGYLAGPMTGLPEYNFPNFHSVAKIWRDAGFEVFNPAETDGGDTSKPRPYYMRKDLQEILSCDFIILMSGWEHSPGARLEKKIADELGLEWFHELSIDMAVDYFQLSTSNPLGMVKYPPKAKQTVCQEADSLIHGDRRGSYGHPLDDYEKTTKAFNALTGLSLTPEQGILFMQCVKLSRQQYAPKRDNLVDLCGYTGLLEMVEQERFRRANTPHGPVGLDKVMAYCGEMPKEQIQAR